MNDFVTHELFCTENSEQSSTTPAVQLPLKYTKDTAKSLCSLYLAVVLTGSLFSLHIYLCYGLFTGQPGNTAAIWCPLVATLYTLATIMCVAGSVDLKCCSVKLKISSEHTVGTFQVMCGQLNCLSFLLILKAVTVDSRILSILLSI